jgi:hypothetical protein
MGCVYLATGSLVADLVQGVDEDARCCARGVWQRIIDDEALAQLQQDEDADEGDAEQVWDGAPQLRIVHILCRTPHFAFTSSLTPGWGHAMGLLRPRK